jgi:hypothetical protein
MSDNPQGETQNILPTNKIKNNIKRLLSESSCDRAILGFFSILFLIVLILSGTVIQEGNSDKKQISWFLYVFSLFIGLFAIFSIIKGGKFKKYGLIILSIAMFVLNLTAMVIARPDIKFSMLFTPHFANFTLMIASIIAAFTSTAITSTN